MDHQVRSKMNTPDLRGKPAPGFSECRAGDLDDAGRREFDRLAAASHPKHLSSYLEIAADLERWGRRSIPGG